MGRSITRGATVLKAYLDAINETPAEDKQQMLEEVVEKITQAMDIKILPSGELPEIGDMVRFTIGDDIPGIHYEAMRMPYNEFLQGFHAEIKSYQIIRRPGAQGTLHERD